MLIIKLHEKIKALRTEKGLTQDQLAAKLFVTKQAVYKWEKGSNHPDIENLKKLCSIFQIKLDDLLNERLTLKEVTLKEREMSMNKKMNHNLTKYINILPLIGIIISVLLFVYFFGITGVPSTETLNAVLYCLTPIVSLTLFVYLPFKLFVFKMDKKNS